MKGYITLKLLGLIPRDSFEAFLTCDKHLHAQPLNRLCQICVFLFVYSWEGVFCVCRSYAPGFRSCRVGKRGLNCVKIKLWCAQLLRAKPSSQAPSTDTGCVSYPIMTCLHRQHAWNRHETGTERNCSLMSKMLSRWAAPLHNRLVCIYLLIIRLIMYVCMHKKKMYVFSVTFFTAFGPSAKERTRFKLLHSSNTHT